MSQQVTNVKFVANRFNKARKVVSEEYNRVTVKSTGKVSVSKSESSNSRKLIIKTK